MVFKGNFIARNHPEYIVNGVLQLTSIEGYADFTGSQITNLGNLRSIGGYAYFDSYSKILGNFNSKFKFLKK